MEKELASDAAKEAPVLEKAKALQKKKDAIAAYEAEQEELKEKTAPEPLEKPKPPVVMEDESSAKEKLDKETKKLTDLNSEEDKRKQAYSDKSDIEAKKTGWKTADDDIENNM